MDLKAILEDVNNRCADRFLANDPLEFPRRFTTRRDREVAAFIAAGLAYGRVAGIRRSLEDLFGRMDWRPSEFVGNFRVPADGRRLEGFVHRFNDATDLAGLCLILRRILEGWGSLEYFFVEGDDGQGADIGPALSSFVERALAVDVSEVYGQAAVPEKASLRYFFPSPARGSACKRLCMFLRWVVRPDDGVDLGLWRSVAPSRLVLPLDTHTARISRLVGLSGRRSANWKMALEVTESLRRLDPADPVGFDFALSHLGISEGCTGKEGEACLVCPLAGLCVVVKGGYGGA